MNVNYYSYWGNLHRARLLCNENFPKAPRAERWEFSAIFLTGMEHQERGISQVPRTLVSTVLFTTSVASVMSHSYTSLALWPHCLVTSWLCVTNPIKKMLPGSWSPLCSSTQSCPHGRSVCAILSPAVAL